MHRDWGILPQAFKLLGLIALQVPDGLISPQIAAYNVLVDSFKFFVPIAVNDESFIWHYEPQQILLNELENTLLA
jgi:hypothetical protein